MKTRKIFALILALAMGFALSACGNDETLETLASGRWSTVEYFDQKDAADILRTMDFYESEIAMAELDTLGVVKVVEFTAEKTYRFGYDVEATKALVREYLDGFIHTLAANRDKLVEDYSDFAGVDVAAMTEEEFLAFYAGLFGSADYPEVLDYLSSVFFNYDVLGEDLETGTFTLTSDRINCTMTGDTKEEYLEYVLTDTTLTLTYSDMVEVYTRG